MRDSSRSTWPDVKGILCGLHDQSGLNELESTHASGLVGAATWLSVDAIMGSLSDIVAKCGRRDRDLNTRPRLVTREMCM